MKIFRVTSVVPAVQAGPFTGSVVSAMLICLLPGGLLYTQETNAYAAYAQETGGGSTENFKRPSNPPVYHRPRPPSEAGGGRVKEDAGAKQGGRTPTNNTAAATGAAGAAAVTGTRAGAAKPERNKTRANTATAPKPARLPSFGGIKSGGGIKDTPNPAPLPSPSASPPANATLPPGEISEDAEDAIEAGNNARDQKPADYVEAERAYTLAAKLAPDDERAFEGLGNIYYDQQRYEEAVTAYRKTVELKPKNPGAFESLGDAYYGLGRYQEAIEASSQSIRLDPKPPGAYWTLTWVNLTIGQGETAGNLANAFIYRWRPLYVGEPPYYITFAGCLGYREAGRTAEADILLAAPGKLNECQDQKWVCRVLKYLRHEISAEQLLTEANDNDKLTEARTYIGIDLALSGRRQEALPHLRWVVANGNHRFTEYPLAKAWLEKLVSKQ